MSVSTEVQRTLVKSPPELWAELSTVEALARHLGELGEIRVTKVEPETRVEWEADLASGVVELKQSGWGTKVTLSLTWAAPVTEPQAARESTVPEPAAEGPGTHEPEAIATKPEPEPAAPEPVNIVEVHPEPKPVAEPGPAADAPPPSPKRGFFARLFKRKPHPPVTEQPASSPRPEPKPAPEIQALALPEPAYPPAPPKPAEPPEAAEPAPEPAVELADLEAQMQQESAELLTGVLDRLGSAHHRPFSRA